MCEIIEEKNNTEGIIFAGIMVEQTIFSLRDILFIILHGQYNYSAIQIEERDILNICVHTKRATSPSTCMTTHTHNNHIATYTNLLCSYTYQN